jgi:hypothetical protein
VRRSEFVRHLEWLGLADAEARAESVALGLCVRLGVFTVPLARSTLSDVAAVIRMSWAADMLTILVDDYGSLDGYVLFAELTQEQEQGLLKGRRLDLCATAGEQ